MCFQHLVVELTKQSTRMTNKITGAKLLNLSSLAQVWENIPIYEIINKGKNKKPTCVILNFILF